MEDDVMSRVPALLLFLFAFAALPAAAQDDFSFGRRIFQQKAECSFCHGWAGDGAGQPQSPGKAANLRVTKLSREQIIMVVSCGIPGTAMPHFDDQAYSDKRCYGMTEADMGQNMPTLPPSTTIAKREIEAVADYILGKIANRGPITREECREVFGERAHSCDEYPAKG
jgi:mono/diheme cytochrome c family protein